MSTHLRRLDLPPFGHGEHLGLRADRPVAFRGRERTPGALAGGQHHGWQWMVIGSQNGKHPKGGARLT